MNSFEMDDIDLKAELSACSESLETSKGTHSGILSDQPVIRSDLEVKTPLLKKVLVVGGAGFVGGHLVDLLLMRQCDVTVYDLHPCPRFQGKVRFIRGSVCDLEQLRRAVKGIETVFHTASVTDPQRDRKELYQVNVEGTYNVVKACLSSRVTQLIYTSTSSAVSDGRDIKGADESVGYPGQYLDFYCFSKAQAEMILGKANSLLNEAGEQLMTCVLRPHAIFGPRDTHFVAQLIEKAKTGRITHRIGDNLNFVDFTFVGNVVYAHYLAALKMTDPSSIVCGSTYFITNGEPQRFWDFIGLVLVEMGYLGPSRKISSRFAYLIACVLEFLCWMSRWFIAYRPSLTRHMVTTMTKHHWFNIDKAQTELGYVPIIPLSLAIEITARYYRNKSKG